MKLQFLVFFTKMVNKWCEQAISIISSIDNQKSLADETEFPSIDVFPPTCQGGSCIVLCNIVRRVRIIIFIQTYFYIYNYNLYWPVKMTVGRF